MRLVGGRVSNEGRIEIYRHGMWGTICNTLWDLQDAIVVCRSMGLPAATYTTQYYRWFPRFGGSNNRKAWMTNLQCFGNESTLEECPHSGYGNVPYWCSYSYRTSWTVCGHPKGKCFGIYISWPCIPDFHGKWKIKIIRDKKLWF